MTVIIVSLVSGFIGGVISFVISEVWMQHRCDNQLYETEFHEDTTTYDVPEMATDRAFYEEKRKQFAKDAPLIPNDDESRRRGGVVW